MNECEIFENILERYKFEEVTGYIGPENCWYIEGEENIVWYSDDFPSNAFKTVYETISPITKEFRLMNNSYFNDFRMRYVLLKANLTRKRIECFWGNSKGIVVNENDDVPYNPTYDNARKLIIFPNNEVYLEMKTRQGKKLIPLSFTQITSGDLENKKFIEFLVYILRIKGREHKIYDKVATYYEKGSCVLFPEHIDELAKYNSFTELIANKYKTVQSLPKCLCTENDINSAYLILKTWGQVESEQRNKLLQARISDANDYVGMKCKDKVFTFIVEIIEKEILKYDYSTVSTEDKRKSLHQLVCDYVRMAKRTKQKIKINFRSLNGVRKEHDALLLINWAKYTPMIEIKAKTKFASLRRLLPKEYEWIRSRKRLIEETMMQHHCVAAYAELINTDRCQIYSYVNDEGQRYTLEFRVSKGRYRLNQVRGKYNVYDGDCIKIQEETKKLIETQNSKRLSA